MFEQNFNLYQTNKEYDVIMLLLTFNEIAELVGP
jgi:hypothetical protein